MVLVRHEIGEVLRDIRMSKRQTLRQVAARAAVALGYLSEIERGQKEVSSELLFSISEALDVPISQVMREVSIRLAIAEGVDIPDTVPTEFVASFDSSLTNA
jgi:transcriptional regulator with XRE-family HTH domain